jgi:hypothetical protein
MPKQVKLGFTDYTAVVFIPDPASTDGSGKTGLVAANLTVSYTRVETDNDVTVTDATSSLNNLSALTDAHTDWGIKEVSSTLAPGLYRLDVADAVFASGAWTAVVYVMITTSAAAASPMMFELVQFDPSTELTEIADAILDRDMAIGVDSGSSTVRTPRQALRAARNKVEIAAGTMTVFKENDSTSSWTAAVTGTAGADPITLIDPVGP